MRIRNFEAKKCSYPGDPVHADEGENEDEDDGGAADDSHVIQPVGEVAVHDTRPVGNVLLHTKNTYINN
jgi:hypothetical protein